VSALYTLLLLWVHALFFSLSSSFCLLSSWCFSLPSVDPAACGICKESRARFPAVNYFVEFFVLNVDWFCHQNWTLLRRFYRKSSWYSSIWAFLQHFRWSPRWNTTPKQAAHGLWWSAGSSFYDDLQYKPSKLSQTDLVFGLWSELVSRSVHAGWHVSTLSTRVVNTETHTQTESFWPVILLAQPAKLEWNKMEGCYRLLWPWPWFSPYSYGCTGLHSDTILVCWGRCLCIFPGESPSLRVFFTPVPPPFNHCHCYL